MIDYLDIQELACAALGMSEEQTTDLINNNEDNIEELLFEKLGVDFDQFSAVSNALIKLTPTLQSPLSKETYHCFIRQVEGGCIAIAKEKAT